MNLENKFYLKLDKKNNGIIRANGMKEITCKIKGIYSNKKIKFGAKIFISFKISNDKIEIKEIVIKNLKIYEDLSDNYNLRFNNFYKIDYPKFLSSSSSSSSSDLNIDERKIYNELNKFVRNMKISVIKGTRGFIQSLTMSLDETKFTKMKIKGKVG